MAKASKKQTSTDEIKIEPGADKRLATILKKALNTPPQHRPGNRQKASATHKK